MAKQPSASVITWPKEAIPDEDHLFMRVHYKWTDGGIPIPGAFRDHNGGMSTDWEKYSTPQNTQQRGRKPDENGVIKMRVQKIRAIANQSVHHTPVQNTPPKPDNRAHTDVVGEKDTQSRLQFTRIYEWIINPPSL
jgi:hypothetical protein